ncbi:hypothetical protein P4203_29765 [Pseudomonas aeruginosa]|nr:hypothetical protein [Pseudomonas aeruginosa]
MRRRCQRRPGAGPGRRWHGHERRHPGRPRGGQPGRPDSDPTKLLDVVRWARSCWSPAAR